MRKLLTLFAVAALSGVLAATALAATKTVTVGDNYFVRDGGVPTVKVKKGTTVKWVWRGSSPHDVKVKKGPVKFSSPVKRSGSYKRKMTRAGTYRIICTIHGAGDQSMKLVVR